MREIVFLSLLLAGGAGFGQTTYEAEKALLSGGAAVQDCADCSGGQRVGNIGGAENGAVTFTNVTVPEGGLYPVTVNVTVYDDRVLAVTVNNEIPQWIWIHRASPRRQLTSQTIFLPLRAGTNTIRFDNPREVGTELDNIVVEAEPAPSSRIAGRAPPGTQLTLSGQSERTTVADSNGHYEFPYLASGAYYVTPVRAGMGFSPYDRYIANLATNRDDINFTLSAPTHPKSKVLAWGPWRIECRNGLATIFENGSLLLSNVYAEVRLPLSVTTMDFPSAKIRHRPLQDEFGRGEEYTLDYSGRAGWALTQTFALYPEFMIAKVKVSARHPLKSRFMAPLLTHSPVNLLPEGDNRALFVPFDNDKWDRYDGVPFGSRMESLEVSAFYNSGNRNGLVIGAIDHDTWKTAVESTTAGTTLSDLRVYGGFTSPLTRDVLPHGEVVGNSIASPRIFIGRFSDWRHGLEAYARANAAVTPPAPWSNGVPFGWNSWGKMQFHLNYDKAVKVSDFFAKELQPRGFEDNGVVYIGLDAGWDHLTNGLLEDFVRRCHANHQEAGIYCTPFAHFGRAGDQVKGAEYHYRDLLSLAHGKPQKIAGGLALDPTHPGTRADLRRQVEEFQRLGFTYLKVDFLVQGALESDHYYDKSVTTGLEAFNSGMKFLRQLVKDKMYLNEAISPIFPGCYAQSRRIACDAFGGISETEYTLNALTYGWWLNGIYRYLDPDLLVLQGYSLAENRSRITSGVITGLMTAGDDFSEEGERAKELLTNEEIDRIARNPKFFRPVEGNTGPRATRLFAGLSEGALCLAVLNYSDAPSDILIDMAQIGWPANTPALAHELWRDTTTNVSRTFTVHLDPADAAIYRFESAFR